MRIEYSEWNDKELSAEERLEQLFRLFSNILLHVSGDVAAAMVWMQYLDDQKGVLGERTLQEFKDKLNE